MIVKWFLQDSSRESWMKKKQADFSLVREKKTLRGKLSKKEKNTKNLPVRLEDQRDPCLVNKKKINLK